MVIEIDICSFTPAAVPFEDESPLPVDAGRMKIGQLAAQFFEMIARGMRKSLSALASSIICNRRNNRPSESDGMFSTGCRPQRSRATNRPEN
jgi:hypothetical protein